MSGYLTSNGTDLSSLFMDKQLNNDLSSNRLDISFGITSDLCTTLTTTGLFLSKGTYIIYLQVYCIPSTSGTIKYAIINLSSDPSGNLLTTSRNGMHVFALGTFKYTSGMFFFIDETQVMNVPIGGTYNLYLQVGLVTTTLLIQNYAIRYIKISD
jgi:hypothetical protein